MLAGAIAVQPAVTPYSSPMKLVEYLAAGCAVVAPGAPNVRELTGEDGEAALLCGDGPEPAPAALRDAVLRLLRDPALRERLGAAARRRVERHGLYWEENARRVEEEVAALRTARPRPEAAALGATPC